MAGGGTIARALDAAIVALFAVVASRVLLAGQVAAPPWVLAAEFVG